MPYATTPLALASLAIIAGVGVLRLLVRGKNNSLNRLITHYGFITIVFFGIASNALYLYALYQSSEMIMLGSVVDGDGSYLPGVVIDSGHARGMTSDTGDFVLAIPSSRVDETYEVTAFLPGYRKASLNVRNAPRMFARFVLKKVELDASSVYMLSDKTLAVGHYMGSPEIYAAVRLKNPGPSVLTLDDFSLRLKSPSGKVSTLSYVYSAPAFGAPLGPAIPTVALQPNQELKFEQFFIRYDNGMQQLSNRTVQALQANPEFQKTGPRPDGHFISDELEQEIQKALNKNWFWESGDSAVTFSCNANGTRYEVSRTIHLSEEQVAAMKNSRDYYQAGYGIIFGGELVTIGEAQPGQMVLTGE